MSKQTGELTAQVPVELLRDARGVIEGLHYTTKSLRSISDRLCSAIADAEQRVAGERDAEVRVALDEVANALMGLRSISESREARERALRQIHDIAAGVLGEDCAECGACGGCLLANGDCPACWIDARVRAHETRLGPAVVHEPVIAADRNASGPHDGAGV